MPVSGADFRPFFRCAEGTGFPVLFPACGRNRIPGSFVPACGRARVSDPFVPVCGRARVSGSFAPAYGRDRGSGSGWCCGTGECPVSEQTDGKRKNEKEEKRGRKMTENKKKVLSYIDEKAEVITGVSDAIWDYAELSLREFKSAQLYVKVLKEEGFDVESPFDGIETAFRASYGSGKPVIGILAEYDALTGLSQVAGAAERKELVADGNGHGCGHNLLGAGSMAAAFAVKKYLEEKGEGSGTVVFYGCPGEEGAATKAFMARDGKFAECDVALTWHPGNVNQVTSGTCNTCIQTEYKFTGVASHAAGAPDKGRSALDAVELMNIGVQFLREHMPDGSRIHYSITDAGGDSPNVVQPRAQVLYMVRSVWAKDALALQERVDRIALAASMMTDTKMEKKFIDGCSNEVPNKALQTLLWENFHEVGLPSYTEEELAYAKALYDSVEMKDENLPGASTSESEEIYEYVDEHSAHGTVPINNFLIPYYYSERARMGSTDVGDVSWCVPTAQINTVTFPAQAPGHSWQNVSCGRTSIAHKGMLLAGKVLAATAIDLIEKPEVLQAAKEEFNRKMKRYGGYFCPVPEGAVPVVPGEKM